MMLGTSFRAAALLLPIAICAAQARAPFTGSVRGVDGQPLVGARVVCAWQPDTLNLDEAERIDGLTDAQGRFAFDLRIGRAYCVWAIGPAAQGGSRAVAFPSYEATGGRRLDLVCATVHEPVRLQVTGTAPWLECGPLALRILVARNCAATADVPIPGDGLLPLPPLPTEMVTVCLVDGRQQVLDVVSLDLRATTACSFVEPHQFDIQADDEDGRPVAGARIVHQIHVPYGLCEPIYGDAIPRQWRRIVATTDGKGRAHGMVVRGKDLTLLHAEVDGKASRLCGWSQWGRIEDGRIDSEDADASLRFALRPLAALNVRVVGKREGEHLAVAVRGAMLFQGGNIAGTGYLIQPATNAGGPAFVATVPHEQGGQARVDCSDDRAMPSRVVATSFGLGDELPEIDLAALRTLLVEVVDAEGRGVPFAHLGVTRQLEGFPLYWDASLVTDGAGRAELRLPETTCLLYAATPTSHGHLQIDKGAIGQPLRIRMAEFASTRLRVVDGSGRAVADARFEMTEQSGIGREDLLPRILLWGRPSLLQPLRTDANGEVVARLPVELDGRLSLRALDRGAASSQAALRLGEDMPVFTVEK